MNAKVKTCLWYSGNGEEAANFYISLLPESKIEKIYRPKPREPALTIDFNLSGTPYQALNGGPQFSHSEAASITVLTKDQSETDQLWNAFISSGGNESQCGWLKDQFGLSWQIVPEILLRLISDQDAASAGRVMQAMMGMRKINIAAIEAAHRGD